MDLREIMRTRVTTIAPDEAASAAWTRMRRRDIRHLVVVDGPRVVGVISERDLGGRAGGKLRKGREVRELMTSRLTSAEPGTTIREAADVMRARLVGCLPVLDGDRLVGIVTATDVFEALGHDGTASLNRAERRLLRAPTSSKRLGGDPVMLSRAHADDAAPKKPKRTAGGQTRAPFAARVPRPAKRTADRTSAPLIPANIRVDGVRLDENDEAFIRQRLGTKLGRYADAIERVTVRVRDVNGPKGGVDLVCSIKVVLSGLPSAVVERQAASLRPALTAALVAAEQAVRRVVQRRRTRRTQPATAGRQRPRD